MIIDTSYSHQPEAILCAHRKKAAQRSHLATKRKQKMRQQETRHWCKQRWKNTGIQSALVSITLAGQAWRDSMRDHAWRLASSHSGNSRATVRLCVKRAGRLWCLQRRVDRDTCAIIVCNTTRLSHSPLTRALYEACAKEDMRLCHGAKALEGLRKVVQPDRQAHGSPKMVSERDRQCCCSCLVDFESTTPLALAAQTNSGPVHSCTRVRNLPIRSQTHTGQAASQPHLVVDIDTDRHGMGALPSPSVDNPRQPPAQFVFAKREQSWKKGDVPGCRAPRAGWADTVNTAPVTRSPVVRIFSCGG